MSEQVRISDGGPAWPCWHPEMGIDPRGCGGMSLLDYFAGQALVGLLAGDWERFKDVASDAYSLADAMLKARKAVQS